METPWGYFVQRGFQFNEIKCMLNIRKYLLYKPIWFFFEKISEIYLFLGHDHLSKFSPCFCFVLFSSLSFEGNSWQILPYSKMGHSRFLRWCDSMNIFVNYISTDKRTAQQRTMMYRNQNQELSWIILIEGGQRNLKSHWNSEWC